MSILQNNNCKIDGKLNMTNVQLLKTVIVTVNNCKASTIKCRIVANIRIKKV